MLCSVKVHYSNMDYSFCVACDAENKLLTSSGADKRAHCPESTPQDGKSTGVQESRRGLSHKKHKAITGSTK